MAGTFWREGRPEQAFGEAGQIRNIYGVSKRRRSLEPDLKAMPHRFLIVIGPPYGKI